MPTPTSLIRNFSIIAHIDHGKSTLADRLLDATDALTDRERKAQFLDSMDLERERGITIKAATVRLAYKAEDGQTYELNLIDTPGHVDFHYEVSRSLAACEGAVLVVDASQGVEAQTLANVYLAVNNNLTIVPVINKIDLPAADPENVRRQIEEVIGIDASEAILASAKEGKGIDEILEAVVHEVPPPVGRSATAPLRVLLLDSWYDSYRGVVILVRVIDGVLRPKQKIRFMAAGRDYEIQTLGAFAPFPREVPELGPGEVGFFTAAIKEVADARVGDTITEAARPLRERAARASSRPSRWSSPGSSRPIRRATRICATRSTSCASTTPRSRASPRRRRRSASVFAAAFWACCTWRSSRSGSSASTTST